MGCATLPSEPTERAYYIDARKALQAEARLGWTVDRVEIEEATAQAEPSACHVPEARRKAVRGWVDARIAASGGPAKERFLAGESRDQLDDTIDLERTRALLDRIELHLPEDCPFWLEPEEPFHGLHANAHRFVLLAESMGAGSLLLSNGRVQVGAGGGVRVFGAYGLSTHLELALGIESGGEAILRQEEQGSLAPEGAFRFGVPAFVRLIDLDRIYDLELAAVARLTEGELTPWGGRVALAGGVSGLRRLGFMPALQLWLGYELYPAQGGLPQQHALSLGTRVGIDWDP